MSLKAAEKSLTQLRKLEAAASRLFELRTQAAARITELTAEQEVTEEPEQAIRSLEIDVLSGLETEASAAPKLAKLKSELAVLNNSLDAGRREIRQQTQLLADAEHRLGQLEDDIAVLAEETRQAIGDELETDLIVTADAYFDAVQKLRPIYRKLYALNDALQKVVKRSYAHTISKDLMTGMWVGKGEEEARKWDNSAIFSGDLEREGIEAEYQTIISTLRKKFPEIICP